MIDLSKPEQPTARELYRIAEAYSVAMLNRIPHSWILSRNTYYWGYPPFKGGKEISESECSCATPVSDPKVEELRKRLNQGHSITNYEARYLLSKLDEARSNS